MRYHKRVLGNLYVSIYRSKGGKARRLTHDHKPYEDVELKRIEKSGGYVALGKKMIKIGICGNVTNKGRVMGMLAVSRAFGDFEMKQWVSVEPYQHNTIVNDNEIMIIGCDGLWDVVSDQEALIIASDCENAQEMAQTLVREALRRGSTDNVSVVTVIF